MLHKSFLLIAAAATLFAACSKDNNSTGSPVETSPPNTDYKPAFNGQTRIGSVTTSTAYEGRAIATTLNKPWGIAALPDGRLLITEKGGTLRIATADGQLSGTITGAPQVDSRGQGGLLGITVDPQFASNRMVYWTFSEPVSGGNHTSVAKGRLSTDEKMLENVSVIYRATPAYNGDKHYGGRILVAADGNLIVSTGERSDAGIRSQAQNLGAGLGKIVRISKDGQPAADNPFRSNSSARPEIWSYGHRNPQGLAVHPQTGDLWESEMGPRGGDEINRIEKGMNYGWPVITYGIEYDGTKVGEGKTQQSGMEQPVYYWDPVHSPSGMTFYSGDAMPEWRNNLFSCGLNSTHIARLVIGSNNRITGEERLLASEGQRFRDITQGTNGALYAVTDEGRLYRIMKK